MKIAENTVVAVEYTLKNAEGEVLDSSEGMPPLEYLHGRGNIIPGLENALEGLGAGEERQVVVAPAEGYGEYNPALVAKVPRDHFHAVETIEPGMKFHAEMSDGLRVMTVKAVGEDTVTMDGNHDLAGVPLHFSVKIVSVREASDEEIQHGRPHHEDGCGCGHHHHHHHH